MIKINKNIRKKYGKISPGKSQLDKERNEDEINTFNWTWAVWKIHCVSP